MDGYGQKSTNGGGIGGSGTVNFVAKFTPNGTTIGDSQIFDNGTFIGIGTTNPLGKFHIFGADNPTRLIIDAENASNAKVLSFRTNGSPRWAIRVESPGGSTSDNLEVRAYNNSGDLLHTPIHITRNSGFVGININVPLAQTHIKGTGNTSGTTAFRVDSSTVNNMFRVLDDGTVEIANGNGYNSSLSIHQKAFNTRILDVFNFDYTKAYIDSLDTGITGFLRLGNNAIDIDTYTSKIGIGVAPSTNKVSIRSNDANEILGLSGNSTTSAAYFQHNNSLGTYLFIQDASYSTRVLITSQGTSYFNGGDLLIGNNTFGLVLKSPNNTSYRIVVDNAGVLSTVAI